MDAKSGSKFYSVVLKSLMKQGMSEGSATDWMYRPNPALDHFRPIDACCTEEGQKRVTVLLAEIGVVL